MPPRPAPKGIRRIGSLKQASIGSRTQPPTRQSNRGPACCDDPKIEDDGDGHSVCRNCFTQVSESNIVADVTFQEDSRGAATVQGGFVGENARHARTLGSAAFRKVGASERNNLQEIEASGRRALGSLCPRLGIPETTSAQALQIYGFAAQHNFSAGRRTDEVIAACLYAACRRQKDNAILLIDIAEILRLNVFRLGEVYKCLIKELYLDDGGGVGTQYLLEVESLVMKYCRRLEFGDETRQVAEDAVRIIRRMKRDWMVTGRHPAGLCGAAIILAARMNNFRRSVREIVWVSKVADMTVAKRVEEFRRTKSAALTVDQFRQYGVLLKHQHDPPSLQDSELKKEKFAEKKRKREGGSEDLNSEEATEDGSPSSTPEASNASSPEPQEATSSGRKRRRLNQAGADSTPPSQPETRRDADGFLIPALPIDPAITAESPQSEKPKRGRPKKQAPEPINITEEELVTEAELENDINYVLNDDEIVDSRNELEKTKDLERAKMLAIQEKQGDTEKNRLRREAEGITWWADQAPKADEEFTEADLEAEFANDPEVLNCILSPDEQQVKERIWIRENEDWLRSHHEKEMRKKLSEATGRNAKGKKKSKVGKRKKKGRMGDGTTLAEATTPIETPADANMAMLEKHAPQTWSKYINYEALRKVYQPSASSMSASGSRAGSQTPSQRESSPDRGDRNASLSASPSPMAARLQTPPATQSGARGTTAGARSQARVQFPPSPSQTQPQATAGAGDEDVESEEDEEEFAQDGLDYGSDMEDAGYGWGRGDDREDIGEDDYRSALDPMSRIGGGGSFDDDEDY